MLLRNAAIAAILAQFVLVPTPQTQYGLGGQPTMLPQVYTQPRALPPQFNIPQYQQQLQYPQAPAARPCLIPQATIC